MNVALFTEMERVDGQGRYWMLHARWLASHGHRVLLLCPESPALEAIRGQNVSHVAINSVRQAVPLQYEDLVRDTVRLLEACEEHRVETMVATAKLPFVMAHAALGKRIPIYVPILSDTYFIPETPYARQAIQEAASYGRVFTSSRDVADAIGQTFGFSADAVRYYRFPMDSATTLPVSDRSAVRRNLGVADDELLVLTITRLDIDKAPSVPHLAQAVDALDAAGLKCRLVVVGDGTLGQQTRAQCSPRTIFTGSRYDLSDLYNACDIYVGEGTTILEAAMSRRPVIVSGASWHRDSPDRVFAIYGVHMFDHGFHQWNNFSPPTSYVDALLPMASDSATRTQLGDAAYETAMGYNHVDTVMPWFESLIAGEPVASVAFDETASACISVPGGLQDGLDTIGKVCAEYGDALKIGVSFEDPVPFNRTLAMPLGHAQALARAVRRRTNHGTPRARYSRSLESLDPHFPEAVRTAIDAAALELPPTSLEPRFTLTPPRFPLHAIAGTGEDATLRQIADAETSVSEGVLVVWIDGPEKPRPDLMERIRTHTSRDVVLITEPLAWTIIGRLISAVETYRDDGSPQFANHRRLAEQLGVTVIERVPAQ